MKKMFKFLILFILVLGMLSCGKSDAQKGFETIMTQAKTGAALDPNDKSTKMIKMLFEKMEYKINKVTTDGNKKANINITVKAINFPAYMGEYMQKMMPLAFSGASQEVIEESGNRYFIELFKRRDLEFKETTLNIVISKDDEGKWNITEGGNELSSAMVAGADKMFKNKI